MYHFIWAATLILLLAYCEQSVQKQAVMAPLRMADTLTATSKESITIRDKPIEIIVEIKPVQAPPSQEFLEFITLAESLGYLQQDSTQQSDTIVFNCWMSRQTQRLIFRGLTVHQVALKEVTKKRIKKRIYLKEAVFPSEQEVQKAGQQIQAFIYQDSTTNAYDKLPTDIFRYQNRIYVVSAGAFMSIPDMKTVCRKFRKHLGPSAIEIMLWDYYGY